MAELDLDWGVATPEGYDDVNGEALHVFNVNLIGDVNKNRILKFVCARIKHFNRHLPPGSSQRLTFDLRGQAISARRLTEFRETIVKESAEHGIKVAVEFLD